MIYVIVDGKERGILFCHNKEEIDLVDKETKEKYTESHPNGTTCVIFDGEKSLGSGEAKVYHTDKFNYVKGRKYALGYALTAAGFSKSERTQVWKQYNDR